MADQSLSIGSQELHIARAADLTHHLGVGENRTRILDNINLVVPPGELVILTGPSGSGKTTLLTLLGALRSGQTGTLQVLGRSVIGLPDAELIELRRSIGFIFQLHNLLDSLSAINNVAMAARLHTGQDDDVKARAARILERVGLGKQMHRRPSGLSGGQRQRVAVARALVNAPRLILADEPTAALDAKSGAEVVGLLQEQVSGGKASCLMVTHDNRVLDRADRIVSLVDGRIVSDVAVREQVIICEMLTKIELFSGLSPAELGQVAERMERHRFAPGDVLVREGEIGEHFFLIRAGEVKVYVGGTDEQSMVATLADGRYFGERALITGEPRNATVAGSRDGVVYALDKARFAEAIAASPALTEQLRNLYFSRQ